MYTPRPIDTSHIKLPETIVRLTERLAENNHEIWAQQRMAEDWITGPVRDDALKTHPDLKPYEELPDSEKEYDRITAMQTLKTILALGYRIVDPAVDSTAAADATEGEAAAVLQRLQNPAPLDLTSGVYPSWGRDGIATKMRYAFGTPNQGFQRRPMPDAMPTRQHTRR